RGAAMNHLVVGHDDDGWLHPAIGQQVVGDEARAPVVVPPAGELTAAAEQVEHGVLTRGVVAGRRVHEHFALPVGDAGVVHVARHGTVWNVPRVVVAGPVAGDDNRAVARLSGGPGKGVVRIGSQRAVDAYLVDVQVRCDRTDRQRPHAVLA